MWALSAWRFLFSENPAPNPNSELTLPSKIVSIPKTTTPIVVQNSSELEGDFASNVLCNTVSSTDVSFDDLSKMADSADNYPILTRAMTNVDPKSEFEEEILSPVKSSKPKNKRKKREFPKVREYNLRKRKLYSSSQKSSVETATVLFTQE